MISARKTMFQKCAHTIGLLGKHPRLNGWAGATYILPSLPAHAPCSLAAGFWRSAFIGGGFFLPVRSGGRLMSVS